MKLCPIAIAVGCKKCPAFKICPLKSVIGDKPPAPEPAPQLHPKARTRTKSAAKPRATVSRKKKS